MVSPVEVQVPVAAWHAFVMLEQVTFAPRQTPAAHTSDVVQPLPSSQEVPSVSAGFEHAPVEVLQVPAEWHWSEAVQTTGVPVHVPLWQLSPVVQGFPSLQAVPSAWPAQGFAVEALLKVKTCVANSLFTVSVTVTVTCMLVASGFGTL